jgi:hypothetical protein
VGKVKKKGWGREVFFSVLSGWRERCAGVRIFFWKFCSAQHMSMG